ncbi:hypothetical protein QYE76_049689 [Lolium multiflorum]|uniref:Uncharacterized protein n=1 Tax=Lolium multiflorum TaxID=4521 RepID=A0AAD8SPM5_LOLMU|nr:hypothetical protein QYE76_049689 [Lolium multiflorum]
MAPPQHDPRWPYKRATISDQQRRRDSALRTQSAQRADAQARARSLANSLLSPASSSSDDQPPTSPEAHGETIPPSPKSPRPHPSSAAPTSAAGSPARSCSRSGWSTPLPTSPATGTQRKTATPPPKVAGRNEFPFILGGKEGVGLVLEAHEPAMFWVHSSPLVNVMHAGACSCFETTSARASMHAAWALMWANTAEARYKSFPANLGPRAGSAREWRLFDKYRHRNSALATAVTVSISTEDQLVEATS